MSKEILGSLFGKCSENMHLKGISLLAFRTTVRKLMKSFCVPRANNRHVDALITLALKIDVLDEAVDV